MDKLQLVATSTMGLESVVARELKQLGFAPHNSDFGVGRTYFQGSLADVVTANIHLRTAGKVLIELARFNCDDFDVLFDAVYQLPWEDWMPRNANFVVEGRSVRSKITSTPALQRTVKKAMVNRLMDAYKTSTLLEDGPEYTVEISLLKDVAAITLDTSGRGLHRRGYRLMNVIAPLRETLASALVQLSVWEPNRPLIDPFCASGTIPIEAAMLARRIAPGLQREFAAQGWPIISPSVWIEARQAAQAQILPPLEEKIIGTDIDAEALKYARFHAQKAGVADDIHFQQKDFADLTSKRPYGSIICNPPYGDRLGEIAQLRPLYESMPAVFSRLLSWSFFIITAWQDFEKMIGQEATRRRKLYNSRIECTYYQFVGPKPPTSRLAETKQAETKQAETKQAEDIQTEAKQTEAKQTDRADWTVLRSTPALGVSSTPEPALETGAVDSLPEISPQSEESVPQSARQLPANLDNGEWFDTETAAASNALNTDQSGPESPEQDSPARQESRENRERKPRPEIKPVFAGLDDYAAKQAEEFSRCLANRARHLRRYPQRGITCYRLYDRDFPEVPLAIDVYEGEFLHISEYERPDDRSPGQHRLWLDKMVETAADVLKINPKNVFLKRRVRQRGESQYEKLAEKERIIDAHEGGLTFLCNMTDYLDTGLFLDHRQTRDMVRKEAENKRFLNLFCYTGAFTCYAAAGKAASTVSVDLSPNYLDWAEANMEQNGFFDRTQGGDRDHDYVKTDALTFLYKMPPAKRFAGKPDPAWKLGFPESDGRTWLPYSDFDLCVCDPPTFSNSKSIEYDWDVQGCHTVLLRLLASRMSVGGVVYFSNNFRRFKLDEGQLSDLFSIREITNRTIPDDFRNKRVHRCWRLIVLDK